MGHLDPQTVRMAFAFLGGLGGTREELCGALSAGTMVLGALFGPRQPGDDEQPVRRAVALFRQRFLREIGPTRCGTLRDGLYGQDGREPCQALVQRAVRILIEVIQEEAAQRPADPPPDL